MSLSTALTDLRPFGKQPSVLDISAATLGCGEHVVKVINSAPSLRGDSEVEYVDVTAGLRQAYVNEEQGLRQKLYVEKLPTCAGSAEPLAFTLRAENGLIRASGTRAVLRVPGGRRLRYDGLVAKDANGNALPVRFQSVGKLLSIEVEANGAPAPLEVTALVWSEQDVLEPAEEIADASFGYAIALDGETAAVAAPNLEAVQIFARSGHTWAPGPVLTRPESSSGGQFGSPLAVSGDTLAVAAPEGSGISIFERVASVWSEKLPVLTGSDQVAGDGFGNALALDGDWLLVGAPADDEQGTAAGAVYAFQRKNGAWTEQAKLLEGDDAKADRYFGRIIAISGQRAAVVAKSSGPGTITVLERSGNEWKELTRIDGTGLSVGPNFGLSVAIRGDLLVVGSDDETVDDLSGAGAVYVFDLSGAEPPRRLVASTPIADSYFGVNVAAGDRAVFATALTEVGSAYFFTNGPTGWAEVHRFAPPEDPPLLADGYAATLAASGNAVLVGAPTALFVPGRAFVYALDDGAPCERSSDCLKGHCVEGVCCDSTCDSPCESCLAALTLKGSDGECAAIPAGGKPREACASDPDKPCEADGLCDGRGRCRVAAPSDTSCGLDQCAGASLEVSRCNGAGVCVVAAIACDEFSCSDGACVSSCASTTDCSSGHFCEHNVCVAQREDGQPCAADPECAHGHCVDDVCCESACDGQCEFCANPLTAGTCLPVVGTPQGNRKACAGDPENPCAITSCDGVSGDSCQSLPPRGTDCTTPLDCPSEQLEQTAGRCDGLGVCECVLTPHCSDDHSRALAADGKLIGNCGNYRCFENACLLSCDNSDDCAADIPCNPTTGRCETPAQKTSSGCAFVRAAPAPWPSSLGFLLLAWLLRRSAKNYSKSR